MMETLARSCGDGHWINAVVGVSITLGLMGLFWILVKWVQR